MAIINPITFLLSRTIAENRGVSDAEANRLGFVGSVMRPPILGVVLASAIASNEAASQATTSSSTGQGGSGGTGKGSGGGSIQSPSQQSPLPISLLPSTGMPSFHAMDKSQAELWATNFGLKVQFEGAHTSGKIDWQEPAIGKAAPSDGVVRLRFAKPA